MLQIRLSKGSSAEGGATAAAAVAPAKAAAPATETVTVTCPDHLVLADLPVAKSVGAVTSSAATSVRSVGRRHRRQAGEKVHFCVRCDLPIAIYGRLTPCEHAFCLTCARSEASCYLCDERIQKIQSVKMMEGIFICAAPHCLKSFLKRSEFESHIHETHADLQPNEEKDAGYPISTKASSTESQMRSSQQEISTARAPPRPGLSLNLNSPHEEKTRQPRPPPLYTNPSQGSEKPDFHSMQVSEKQSLEKPSGGQMQPAAPDFLTLQIQPPLPPNYAMPLNPSQALISPPLLNYPPTFPAQGSQPYPGVSIQGAVLGFGPAPAGVAGFVGSLPLPLQMPPPPPPPVHPASSQQLNAANFSNFGNVNQDGHGYGS
uniref:RING-type E3 ubiquitin transferase n=1 Tax=Ananas comosus var. bracteatus TaxID=296719 RepID=A0A6V7PJA3_ANACO|nr:unnamed protein product [Ananas comosus var. bracteatus]